MILSSLFRVGSVIVVATVLLITAGCSENAKIETDFVRPVKTTVVTGGNDIRERSFPGTVEAARRVDLAFRVSGLLAELPAVEGQRVTKGTLIARLRQDEFEARVKTLQGELDQALSSLEALRAGERPEEISRREAAVRAARARLANTRAEHERSVTLLDRKVISQAEYDASETAYQVAQEEYASARDFLEKSTYGRAEDVSAMEAQVRALQGRLVEAQIQLEDSTLLAPYDGVIARRLVDQDQNIRAGDLVVEFQDVEEIDIAVDVPEAVMAREIQLADILQMTAELSSAPGIEFPVRIREIAQVADPVTQTFNVRVAMESSNDLRVLPGMTAAVRVSYRRASILGTRVLIPTEAVAQTPDGAQVVWVLETGGDNAVDGGTDQAAGVQGVSVRSRPVQLGEPTGGRVEVLQGIQPGDVIVVAGVRFLREGMKVRDLGDALGGGSR